MINIFLDESDDMYLASPEIFLLSRRDPGCEVGDDLDLDLGDLNKGDMVNNGFRSRCSECARW